MPTMYDDVNAKCPYFRFSHERRITCEGITDRCVTQLEFKAREERNQHRNIFCDAKYTNCEIHRMLNEKYEE